MCERSRTYLPLRLNAPILAYFGSYAAEGECSCCKPYRTFAGPRVWAVRECYPSPLVHSAKVAIAWPRAHLIASKLDHSRVQMTALMKAGRDTEFLEQEKRLCLRYSLLYT